jgi:uncharacterized Rmd1/YagE family protein
MIYKVAALHVAEKLKLKDLRDRMINQQVVEFSNYEMIIKYAENSYGFIYNYGSVVFFNVPEELQLSELKRVREDYKLFYNTSEVFLLEVQEELEPSVGNKVFFDRVVVKSLTFEKVKQVCMLIAESTGLEYYENQVEKLLESATHYSRYLQTTGKYLKGSKDLIKFIGLCLNTKQEIISNLYIVDSPDETWENPELDKLFKELKQMLEIDIRYRALEYKVKIIQDSIEVMADLAHSRREVMLELVVILLITFEIILSLIRIH